MKPHNPATRDALSQPAIHQKWVSTYRTPETQAFYEAAFDEIASQLNAPRDAPLLDAGCGSCAKSVLLAARGFRVTATDFSITALELGAETVRAHGLSDRVTIKRGDLLALPFRDGEFPYVVCWGVLMHVPQFERALAELARVVAPGGMLVVSEGNMHSAQSVALRGMRRVLGKRRGRVVRTAAGIETHEHTHEGHALVTRQIDVGWFTSECARLGLRRRVRIPGQFTELYGLLPWRPLRRAVHVVNHVWFHHVRLPGPAFGNILIFEKVR